MSNLIQRLLSTYDSLDAGWATQRGTKMAEAGPAKLYLVKVFCICGIPYSENSTEVETPKPKQKRKGSLE